MSPPTQSADRVDPFRLDGKTALVTGCRCGIGKAMVVGLARAGADTVGVSASLERSDGDIEREVRQEGRKFTGYSCDFSDRDALHGFIRHIQTDGDIIDIRVNNAGTFMRAPAATHSDDFWDRVIEVNLNAQFVLSREIGKEMLERGHGKIFSTALLLTFQGVINVPGYAASKGAIGQMTMALANKWAGRGVNVNAIAPGYIATDNKSALRADETRSRSILDRLPACRWGTPDDLVGDLIFLCSPAAAYAYGTILPASGGWLGR